MSQVIGCPHCGKTLALRDEWKGRTLICPQCRGRFTTAADPSSATVDVAGRGPDETPSPGGSDMAFLDDLSPLPGPATANMAAKTSNATRAAAFPTDSITSRMAAIRAKKKSDQVMMIYIGGGIAAVVLLLVVVAMSMRADGDATKKKTEKEVVRFGLTDSVRHELFGKFILAVDQYGVTKDCKAEWLRLADAYKLDRRRIGDVLDEGFSRNDWDQPAPAHITNKTRGARMEWHAGRANGGDPILAF